MIVYSNYKDGYGLVIDKKMYSILYYHNAAALKASVTGITPEQYKTNWQKNESEYFRNKNNPSVEEKNIYKKLDQREKNLIVI